MKILSLLIIAVAQLAFLTARGDDTKLEKVSSREAGQIRRALQTGDWVSVAQAGGMDACTAFRRTLPASMLQGFVEVPEDAANPASPKLQIFYWGRIIPGADTVVFHNGGPASDGHGSYDLLLRQPGARNLSFIFIDQRGTGCSTAYPSLYEPETLARLKHYGSRGIVHDSEAVRAKVLGPNGKWKVFGQSYGGKIVHRYLTMTTEHLLGAYAHGYSIMSDGDEWMVMRIQSQVRVLNEYLKQYPDDARIVRELRSKIPEDKCFTDGDLRVCGPKVLDGLVMYLGFTSTWPTLHQYITALITGAGTVNYPVLGQFVRMIVFGAYGNNYVPGSVIGMVDMSTGEPTFDFCTEPLRRLRARGEDPDGWVLNECRLMAGLTNEKWDPWLREMTKDKSIVDEATLTQLKAARLARPEVPFYLYAGAMDVFVPAATFAEETAFLGSVVNFTLFPESGHEGFYTEAKVWEDLNR